MENKIAKIKKRDGRIVDFDNMRIANAIYKAFLATSEADGDKAELLAEKVREKIAEKFSAKKKIPNVEEIQDAVEETLTEDGFTQTAKAYILYRQKRREIREAKYFLLAQDVRTKLSKNALTVLESRYLRKDEQGKLNETPQQLFQRVASNIAAAEKIHRPHITDEDLFKIEEKFYRLMASLEFLPNSPTLMNAGGSLQQLSACFVLPVEDAMDSIFEAVKNTALIHQSGGGTGFDFSRLRPEGDSVKSTQGTASGPISFMTVFDAATNVVKQGGKRRGANMGILRVDHPDILKFITAKKQEGILPNFNMSVALTDEFMEAVKKDAYYDLFNPRTRIAQGKLKAKEVFDMIVNLAWSNGEPGIVFIDKMNRDNPTPKLGKIESTNPCAEQPLLPYESCNLGSINLVKMLKEQGGHYEVDWEKIKRTTRAGVHFLDNVIDMNRYPIAEIEAMTKQNRKIGLGIMGWADMLIKLRIPYNSDKAIELGEKIMQFINKESKVKSQEIATFRGVFPSYQDSIYNKKDGWKLRNATTTTIAPTGTIGIVANCSSGIEPHFAIAYIRKHVLGGKELTEVNPLFEEIAKKEGWWSEELILKIADKGTVKNIQEVPEFWRKIFVTAMDMEPVWHIKMQAAFQNHVDNAVSKTVNFPFNASIDDIKNAYWMAYENNCKGITIYRNESRKQQVLNIGKKEEKQPESIQLSEKDVAPELRDPSPAIPDLPPGSCPTCNI
ncbi:MAG: ribonucleoside-diphosphate reductase, adenosylcobalamin-dependent [Candidatus Portnoybacteria bacterium CG10_big_fil_rev_8_21_14_0_10_36_7]|uniref:Vitamin B12-dependent ribonucleotide reductase n=1 Tax=Candidatus Portnoybacteria bacterium CG10_big_fil_rev_8_21_14_0_10_36_7 TaxID=1974812 RepID=A0A2M8KDZ3_9BACT|nr:MAG: ribonucleoside-diphosphate reductase, adenosylcobalamin-dependent [Candidatus Portnoybacteria bacterium CG10_big_fil_rev_8_21_14_0_10_36_7]